MMVPDGIYLVRQSWDTELTVVEVCDGILWVLGNEEAQAPVQYAEWRPLDLMKLAKEIEPVM